MAVLSIKSLRDRINTAQKRLAMKCGKSGLTVLIWELSEQGVPSRNDTLFARSDAIPGALVMNIVAVPRGKFLAPGNATADVPIDAPDDSSLGDFQGVFDLTDEIEQAAIAPVAVFTADASGQMTMFDDAVKPPTGPTIRVPRLVDAPVWVSTPVPKLKISDRGRESDRGETFMPETKPEPTFMDDPAQRDAYLAKVAEVFSDEKIEQRRAERDAAVGVKVATQEDIEELQRAMARDQSKDVNPVVKMAHGGAVAAQDVPAKLSEKPIVVLAAPSPFAAFTPSDFTPMEL